MELVSFEPIAGVRDAKARAIQLLAHRSRNMQRGISWIDHEAPRVFPFPVSIVFLKMEIRRDGVGEDGMGAWKI